MSLTASAVRPDWTDHHHALFEEGRQKIASANRRSVALAVKRGARHSVDDAARTGERAVAPLRDRKLAALFDGAVDAPHLMPRAALIRMLTGMLDAEKRRRAAGHWTADRNREIAIRQQLLAERFARLKDHLQVGVLRRDLAREGMAA